MTTSLNKTNDPHHQFYGDTIRSVMKLSDCRFPIQRIPVINIGIPAGKPLEKICEEHTNVLFPFNFFPRVSDGYVIQVNGHSMINAGIDDGDLLLVNKSVQPEHRDIVIASVNGEMTVKRYLQKSDCIILAAENESYAPIKVTSIDALDIFGVVIRIIKEPK